MPLEFQKEVRECGAEKIFEEKMSENSPILTDFKRINPPTSASPKQDKLKEIHAQIHHD